MKMRTENHPHELQMVPSRPCQKGRVIFIIENAALKKSVFGNRKMPVFFLDRNKYLDDYQVDFVREVDLLLLTLSSYFIDSPLNKYGVVGAIYVKIASGVLFEVKSHVHLPRTLKRFCSILQRSCWKNHLSFILAILQKSINLLLILYNGIPRLSYSSQKVVDIDHCVSAEQDDLNIVLVVGAMVHGKSNMQSTDDFFPLTSALKVSKLLGSFSHFWGVL
ncbi:tRNA (pseudouridine(54)-N(1))-methyltransferase [Bertholletia excelsa]